MQSDRTTFCKSLVLRGAKVIRDGKDHSQQANRCIVSGGECVGYYSVLSDYDEASDTFGIGFNRRVPSGQVDDVEAFDAIGEALNAITV